MKVNFQDGTLFGNDAGEDEDPAVLASYFVDQPAFKGFLDAGVRLQIARSRKGMGKSALLSKLHFDLDAIKATRPIVVRTTGTQLVEDKIPDFGSYLEAQGYWISHICSRINASLGTQIGFAFSDTQMALVESAELTGLKERNLVGALLNRIRISKIPIEVIEPTKTQNPDALLRRALDEFGAREIWLLVDDVDASYVDSPQAQMLISSFFSACRFVAREMKGVHVRATVRSDVWSNLRSNEDLDKCEQYIIDIVWSKGELREILSKKISAWIERNNSTSFARISHYDHDRILELAFERRLKWGRHKVPPFQPIHILSAGRPRWMSQLCRLSGAEAARRGRELINISHINHSMRRYTRFRLNDLYKEHSHQFRWIEKLVQAFAGGPVRYSTDELSTYINRNFVGPLGVKNIGYIDGEEYNSPLQLAHFLYKIGFILARKGSGSDSRSAKFIQHSEMPELLRHSNAPGREFIWEIYPSYRQQSKLLEFSEGYQLDEEEPATFSNAVVA